MIKRLSKKERREALKNRVHNNIETRNNKGFQRKSVLDLSSYDNVQYYKPKEGNNIIDIIPWVIQTDLFAKDHIKPGMDDYVLDVWVHTMIGPMDDSFVCLKNTVGKPCPICDERKLLKDSGNATDKQLKTLNPRRRCFYNIINLEEEDKGIQLFEASHSLFEKELLDEVKNRPDGMEYFADLEDGYTIKFRGSMDSVYFDGKEVKFLKYKSFSFIKRDPYEESILDSVYPLDKILVIPSYKEVQEAYLAISDECNDENSNNENNNEEQEEEKREKSIKSFRKSKRVVEEEEQEKEEEDISNDGTAPWEDEKEDKDKEMLDSVSPFRNMNKRQLREYIKLQELDIKITREISVEDLISQIEKAEGNKNSDTKEENKCPAGKTFGNVDEYNECADGCPVYNECADAWQG